jgi:hypothetical protein
MEEGEVLAVVVVSGVEVREEGTDVAGGCE